jgi:nucleoside-diphosphate-sugar epimerase
VAQQLLCLGYGYVARAFASRLQPSGWSVAGTYRSSPPEGVQAIPFGDLAQSGAVGAADAILVSAPPTDEGDVMLPLVRSAPVKAGVWIGYLSTTGVYGDRGGAWVTEDDPVQPLSEPARRRVAAEAGWLSLGAHVFRLPGIYGPGRSALDRVREGVARRVVKPGLVHSRIHVADIASALTASLERPHPGRIYNITDDEPTPPEDVILHACALLGAPVPAEVPWSPDAVPPNARRFYEESRRVSNARARAELGWRPQYPTYREGLAAILAAS